MLQGASLALLERLSVEPPAGAPDARHVVAPSSLQEASDVMALAAANRLITRLWGAGTHQGYGYPVEPDLIVTTERLDRVVEWQPDDLTLVVESGIRVDELEAMLAERSQTAVLPETSQATLGGAIAAAASPWRRLRYGPLRDRMLETMIVTGDGRIVRAGGRVVKNVTGYDIPRLVVGSFGSLGLIGQVCLKLWPRGVATATIPVPDAAGAFRTAYRPLAVLETESDAAVYLAGTEAEIEGQAADLNSSPNEGLAWPEPLAEAHRFSLRVPPALMGEAVDRVRPIADRFVAAHGVGEIAFGTDELDSGALTMVRRWAESASGALVVTAGGTGIDPWGAVPSTVEIQRRVKEGFDPAAICNPGILPGGI